MNKTRSLMEAALLSGLSAVLFLATSLPLIGAVTAALSPVPLLILEIRHDFRYAVLGSIVATLVVMMIFGPIHAVGYFLSFAIFGICLGRIIELRRNPVEVVFWAGLVSLAGMILSALFLFSVTGVNPFTMDIDAMINMFDKTLALMPDGAASPKTVEMMKRSFAILPMVMPAIFICVSVLDAVFSYWFSGIVLRRLKIADLQRLPSFETWRFPSSILWAFVVSVACLWLGAHYKDLALLTRVGVNLDMIIQMLFTVQGMSLLSWYLQSKGMKRGTSVFWSVLPCFFLLTSQLISFAGLLDMIMDLRSRFGGDR